MCDKLIRKYKCHFHVNLQASQWLRVQFYKTCWEKAEHSSKGWIVPAWRHVHIFEENVLPKSLMIAFQKKEKKKNQLQLQT